MYETDFKKEVGDILKDLINIRVHDYYWNKDLSCVVTTLKILSELFRAELNPDVLSAAFGLNAGRCGYKCGLVEGTLMFIGLYGSPDSINNERKVDLCHKFCNRFETRFNSLLCKELRPEGFVPTNPPHLCEGLTKEAIAFSAEFIKANIEGPILE